VSIDTIYALSSGRPPAAVSIIRVSGPRVHEAGRVLAGSLPDARQAALRTLRDAKGGVLDEALVLRFDGPASATGENTVEFQCHGGRAVVDAVLAALAQIEGLRVAAPGEFTRRAFENGRIDLTEAEGLADLIEAETETQRKAALAMAEGGLRHQVEQWQQQLLTLSARAEAAIDYVGEDDVEPDPTLVEDATALGAELSSWLDRPRVEPLKNGVRVVVAGPPNAGKSSLLNAIAGEERAIVTDIPGTTRDHIEVPLSLDGMPIVLTDTAGLRDTDQLVERIGVDRARLIVERADVLLWLGEPAEAPSHPRLVQVHSRADLPGRAAAPAQSIAVSSATGEGLRSLLERVAELASAFLPGESAVALNRRQAAHITEANNALRGLRISDDPVLLAEQFRTARAAFDQLTGRAGIEEVLDALFGRFCLGK
jgi:tRNA modification GTPase